MTRVVASVVLFLALAAGAVAATPAEEAAAAYKEAGTAAFKRGDYAAALEAFRRSYAAGRSPLMHYNLGLSLGRLRRDLEALEEFDLFVAEARDAPEEHRAFARAQVAELERRFVRLEVACNVPGAEVLVDGRRAGRAALWISPGSHDLAVSAPGYVMQVSRVSAGAGQRRRVEITLQATARVAPTIAAAPVGAAPVAAAASVGAAPVAAAAVTGAPPPASKPLVKRWWFWTVIGVAVAGTVTAAAVAGALASQGRSYPSSALGPVCPYNPSLCN
jgi:hypothetical protein